MNMVVDLFKKCLDGNQPKCTGETATPAMNYLRSQIENEHAKGLITWRLSNKKVRTALEQFCSRTDGVKRAKNLSAYQQDVQLLFDDLNKAMAEQELLEWPTPAIQEAPGGISVIFGGKPALKGNSPRTISEEVIHLVIESKPAQVFTVSRSKIPELDLPKHVSHIAKQNLLSDNGVGDFSDVIQTAVMKWKKSTTPASRCAPLKVYFTLGQHKGGEDPYKRNVIAATNFAKALKESKKALQKRDCNFRVIITGTDATNPRSFPDYNLEISKETISCPAYKMWDGNFVYSLSKLCQFYIIADAIVDIVHGHNANNDYKGIQEAIICLSDAINSASGNIKYQDSLGITREKADDMSIMWNDVEHLFKRHLKVARNISIVYTPLHGNVWAEIAHDKIEDEDPDEFIVKQIISRMKNAISIHKAASTHF